MKKTDIAMIVLIAGLSVFVAYFAASAIPQLNTSNLKADIPTVEAIDPGNDMKPDEKVFAQSAINPTQQTIIGASQ